MTTKKKKDTNIYNLQIPIDKGLEKALRGLADEDDRNLRAYCRRILQLHVENKGIDFKSELAVIQESTEITKPRIGGFKK